MRELETELEASGDATGPFAGYYALCCRKLIDALTETRRERDEARDLVREALPCLQVCRVALPRDTGCAVVEGFCKRALARWAESEALAAAPQRNR